MQYRSPKSHTPRTRIGSRPSPASSRASAFTGGVSVTSTRGKAVVSTVVTAAPANTTRALRVASDNATRWRIQQAIQRAFPYPRPFPGGGPARAFAHTAGRYAETIAQAQSIGEQVGETLSYVDDVVAGQWWQQSPAYDGPNPGLTFLEVRTHTSFTGPNYTPPANTGYAIATDNRLLSQNSWLRFDDYAAPYLPGSYLGMTLAPGQTVPNNHYLYIPDQDFQLTTSGTPRRFYASYRIYRNLSGSAMEAIVSVPGALPTPLGVPLPAGMPEGYPLAKPQAVPSARRLPRPQRSDEVAIDIGLGGSPRLRVYRARARKPGNKGKETKAYGKAGVASVIFWLYEATDDWVDWINIIVSAIPSAPSGMSPTQQLAWLRDNPASIATAAWGDVVAGLAGWAVDEAFGAFVGNINRRANRSTSVSATTIDMRTNVGLHYSPASGSPGQFVTAFLRSFL